MLQRDGDEDGDGKECSQHRMAWLGMAPSSNSFLLRPCIPMLLALILDFPSLVGMDMARLLGLQAENAGDLLEYGWRVF